MFDREHMKDAAAEVKAQQQAAIKEMMGSSMERIRREARPRLLSEIPKEERDRLLAMAGVKENGIRLRSELLGGLEPRNGGMLRKCNPTPPPTKPPVKTVAIGNDDRGRRFRVTTIIEEI